MLWKLLPIISNNDSTILISVVMKKLPKKLCFELLKQIPTAKWVLAKLIEVFLKELASRERFQSKNSSETSPRLTSSQCLNSRCILYVVSENHNQNPLKITCTYFRQYHPSNCCRVATDVSARRKILQEKFKCYNCLKAGHSVKNCTSQHCCFDRKKKHHISICGCRAKFPLHHIAFHAVS